MQDDNDAMSGLVPDAYTQAVQGHQRQALLDALAGNGGGAAGLDTSGLQDPGSAVQGGAGAAPGLPGLTTQADAGADKSLQPVANYSAQGSGANGGIAGGPPAGSAMSCQSSAQSGKAVQTYMAQLAHIPYSDTMHRAGIDVLQKAQADAANNAGDRAMLDDIGQLARNKGLDSSNGTLTAGVKALAAKYGVNLNSTQSNADVMRQLLGGMTASSLAHGDSMIANVLSNSLSAKALDSGAVANLLPVLRSQLDLKDARANVATSYFMAHPNNLSGLPALMNNFNQIADPGTVSFGRRMAQVNGTPAHDQLINNLVQKYPNNWCDYTNRVRTMDEMGAFTHAGN